MNKSQIGEKTLKIMNSAVWYNNWVFSFIKPYLAGEILEVGAGIGNFTKRLSKFGKVTCVDIDKKYISRLRNKRVNAGLGNIEKNEYFFGNKKFDTIVCMNVLEHIKNDNIALENIYKLLESGGTFVLLVPAHKIAYGSLDKNLGHFRRYSKRDLKEKLRNSNFRVQNFRYLNWLGVIGWIVNSKILKRRILPKNQVDLFDRFSRSALQLEKFTEPPFGLSILVIARK